MTCVNIVLVELNEILYIYINNVTTLLNHKINHKMTMSCKLVWMDEKSFKLHLYATTILTWCNILSFAIEILSELFKMTRSCSKLHVVIITKN